MYPCIFCLDIKPLFLFLTVKMGVCDFKFKIAPFILSKDKRYQDHSEGKIYQFLLLCPWKKFNNEKAYHSKHE